MRLLWLRIKHAGYDTYVFDYPSTRGMLELHINALYEYLKLTFNGRPLYLVGHSLGGILIRGVLDKKDPALDIQKVIMLGTPNNGAKIAKFLNKFKLVRWVFGPCLEQLSDKKNLPSLPPNNIMTSLISGGIGNKWGFLPFFLEDNDGIVTVSESYIEGVAGHYVLPVMHAWMPFSKPVAKQVVSLLK